MPHHTFAMEFILGLPINSDGINAVMSVTCNFSQRDTVVPGKDIDSAKTWTKAYSGATVG